MRTGLWLFVGLAICCAGAVRGESVRYYAITLGGAHAGYSRVQTQPDGAGLRVTSDCLIKAELLGSALDLRYQAFAAYAAPADTTPTQYRLSVQNASTTSLITYTRDGNKLHVSIVGGGTSSTSTITLGADDLFIEGNLVETYERALPATYRGGAGGTFRALLASGQVTTPVLVKWSSPTHCTIEIASQTMELEFNSARTEVMWLKVPAQKAEWKLADAAAMRDLKPYEAAARAFAVTDVGLPNPDAIDKLSIKVTAQIVGESPTLAILNNQLQRFTGKLSGANLAGEVALTRFIYNGLDSVRYPVDGAPTALNAAYLQPDALSESNDPEIKAAALGLVKGAATVWEATVRIGQWVHANLKYRITGADASTAFRSREGDCGPHTNLCTAMLRAVGIPARMVGGALYTGALGGSFGQHYWTEVWTGPESLWVPIDTTTGEIGTLSPLHLTLWRGGGGIGSLSVSVLDYEPKPAEAEPGSALHSPHLATGETWRYLFRVAGKDAGVETAHRITRAHGDRIEWKLELNLVALGGTGKATLAGTYTLSALQQISGLDLRADVNGAPQLLTAHKNGNKVGLHVVASGHDINRTITLPAGGVIVMGQTTVPWDLVCRSSAWKPNSPVQLNLLLADRLTLIALKLRLLRDETITLGAAKVHCHVLGDTPAGQVFYVNIATGKLVKTVGPKGAFEVIAQ